MQVQILLLSLGLCLCGANILGMPTEEYLLKYLINPQAISNADSNDCFQYYFGKIDESYQSFLTEFSKCLKDGEKARQLIDDSMALQREYIRNNVTQSCEVLQKCQQYDGINSSTFFGCYEYQAPISSINMTTTGANSKLYRLQVDEQYNRIQANEDKCTAECERCYKEETDDINLNLGYCLSGKAPVPQAPVVPNETTTTEQPVTTVQSTTEETATTESEANDVEEDEMEDPISQFKAKIVNALKKFKSNRN